MSQGTEKLALQIAPLIIPNPNRGIEKLCDPTYLPGSREVRRNVGGYLLRNYGVDASEFRKEFQRYQHDMQPSLIRKAQIYEILTGEYVADFTDYLAGRAQQIKPNGEPLSVVEVGAGHGRLTHFVNQRLADYGANISVLATDSGDYSRKYGFEPALPVVNNEGHLDALKRNPDIVVSSWMPDGQDWTPDFRATDSVQEYILIGWPLKCGHYSSTASQEDGQVYDGFRRVELPDLEQNQACFCDDMYPYKLVGADGTYARKRMSRTVSYRRV